MRTAVLVGVSLFFLVLSPGQARVLNINKESFAAYLSGSWAPSFTNTLFSESSTTASVVTDLDASQSYNSSGEFGFIYASPSANIRFGLEIMKPSDFKDVTVSSASGEALYNLTSQTSLLIPKVALELQIKHWSFNRLFLEAGVGYADLTERNSYTFTSGGTTAYSGLTDFTEELRGSALMYEGALGLEGLFSDMTTYTVQVGYRSLQFSKFKHNKDVTPLTGAAVAKGDVANTINGVPRSLDLSNYFVGLGLRFWIR